MPACKKCGQQFKHNNFGRHAVACQLTPPPAELARLYAENGRPGITRFARMYDVSDSFMRERLQIGMAIIDDDGPLQKPPSERTLITPADVPRCDRCELLLHTEHELHTGHCRYCIEELQIA